MAPYRTRHLDLTRSRNYIKALDRGGYKTAAQSILQGLTRVINVHDDDDWKRFRQQISHHQADAWYGPNLQSFLSDETLASFAVSYRHTDWQNRSPEGATMNDAQWSRLRKVLLEFASTYNTSRFCVWMDQVLYCSQSMGEGVNWVTKGVMPYSVLPVVYVGGPDERQDEEHKARLWVAIERMSALTNAGIAMRGNATDRSVMIGASLTLPQALQWLASRVLGGCFNSCDLSWTKDYLSFRELSVGILKTDKPLEGVEAFLRSSGDPPRPSITSMDAFNFSADGRDISFGGGHLYLGTYLASRLTRSTLSNGGWHGLREWVQYYWDDGALLEESAAERKQIIDITKWFLFADDKDASAQYALGLVSQQGIVGAMGIAHLRGASSQGHGRVLWFQRGLSQLSHQYARSLFFSKQLGTSFHAEISKHWRISFGAALGMLNGADIQWQWS